MKRISILLGIFLFCGISATVFYSCVKKDFDAPPDTSGNDPNIPVTHSIAQLLTMPEAKEIDADSEIVISGIVIADDRSGNFYKTIVIQDSTAGIQILLDQNNLYNDYPIGRKVYVKCKGLYLGNYGGTPQLGYAPDGTGDLSNIPFTLIADHIVKASSNNTIIPDTVTISDLNSKAYINKLVIIKDIQFSDETVGMNYAEPATISSGSNRDLEDCNSASIILRNSAFAKFQPALLPAGNGTIIAVNTVYNKDLQLIIRDTTDINFNGERCDGTTPNGFLLNEGFESLTNWTAISVSGVEVWKIAQFGKPKPCAAMSGFASGNHENEDWLISKQLDLTGLSTISLSFESAAKFGGDTLKCFISTNYTSGDPSSASWTLLPAIYADVNGNFEFTPSGNVDLSSYAGQQIRIAFKYTSTNTKAPTWEIDNVKVTGE